MAFTTCPVATNNIASLDDLPNDVGGLTPAQLKAVFDKFGADFVAWFNATHLGELPVVSEGNWTPLLKGSTVPGAHTYNSQTGVYHKIGKKVYAYFNIALSAKDALMSGNVNIGGLPFVSAYQSAGSIGALDNIDLSAGNTQYLLYLASGVSYIDIRQCGDNITSSNIAAAAIASNSAIRGCVEYIAAE